MLTEYDMLKGCRKFNPHAQQFLFKKYENAMRMVCMRYARNSDESRALLQCGFIKVFENIPRYKGNEKLDVWIKRIMVNTIILFYKISHQDVFTEMDVAQGKPQESEWNDAFFSGEVFSPTELLQGLHILEDTPRIIFNMHDIDGISIQEISAMLKLNEKRSGFYLFKARKILQDYLLHISLHKKQYRIPL